MEFLNRLNEIHCLSSGKYLTSTELLTAIDVRQKTFLSAGVRNGSLVFLTSQPDANFFISLFALWKLKATAAPLSRGQSHHSLQSCLDAFDSAYLVSDVSKSDEPICLKPTIKNLSEKKEDFIALLLSTSGSTGKPKVIPLSYQAILHRCRVLSQHIPPDCLKTSLCVLPLSFAHGLISNSLFPMLYGAELLLPGEYSNATAHSLLTGLETRPVTFVSSVPGLWRQIRASGISPKCKSLLRLHIASAICDNETIDWLASIFPNTEIWNMYGLTETSSWVAGGKVPRNARVGWVGKELEEGSIKLAPDREILLKTPAMLTEYLGEENLSKSKIKDGWLFTGDIGFFDSGGCLLLKGRKDFVINKNGNKFQPEEIESIIHSQNFFKEVCISAQSHPIFGEDIAAVYVAKEGLILKEAQKKLETILGRSKMPSTWIAIEKMPQLENGKIDRKKIRSILESNALSSKALD
jgi:acyl-CoA synthetase (AMP-forming)/AMP-acid ligase II